MNDILIKIDTKTAKAHCEYNKIGVQHANLQNKLIFKMSEKIEGSAWLEYEIGGNKNYAVMEEIESGYQIDIKSCLLISNYVNIDLKITESENADGIPIFISTIVELDVDESINATEEEPEYYPDWKTVADSKIAEMNQLKEEIEAAIEETNNLNIDVSDKVNKEVNITLTKKDNTTKRVTLKDGTSLMFNWDGTRLGIKTDEDEEYTYVDLIGPQGIQGEPGTTPNLTIGTVVTGNTSSATITGTPENPILNLVLEKGETGETGATGNGILNIEKTSTVDNVDTYTIYYTNGTTSTFTVTNSTVTNQEFEELKAEHEELVNTLPRVEETGESITLDNTAQYKMNVALNPSELSQTTYTGANLFDKTTATIGWINENGTITFNNEYATSDFIEIDSSSQYSKTATNSPRIKLYDENKNLLDTSSYSDISSFGNKGTYTIPNVNAKYIRFSTRTILDSSSLDAVMFVKGSTLPTSYEPYVGGVPSPNPLYPQPIKKVTGDNTINVCGKQLFQSTYIQAPGSTKNAVLNAGTYTLSTCDSNTFASNIYFKLYDNNGNIITTSGHLTSTTSLSFSSTSYAYYGGAGVSKITFTLDANYQLNIGLLNADGTRQVMLVIGSEIIRTYEPYQSQTYPINLGSLEYCKIGNYSDEIFITKGKNLFDKDNANILSTYINEVNSTIIGSGKSKTIYIKCNPNTTYTISKTVATSRFVIGTTTNIPDLSAICNQVIANNNATSITITTGINDNYLCAFIYHSDTDSSLTLEQVLSYIQIEKGPIATPYEPYGIGNWYIRRNIGKNVFDGTEAYNYLGGTTSNPYYVFYNNNNQLSNSVKSTIIYSNYFIVDNSSGLLQRDGGCRIAEFNSTNRAFFCIHSITSVNDFKTWLTTHNTIIYYILATPTYTQITDTTLITQLNNLYNQIKSYKGQTNITQTNAELPFNIDASALYDLNNLISRVATLETEV